MINSLLDEYIPSILDPSHRQRMSTRWGHWGHSEPRHHAHVVDQTGQIQPARRCSVRSLLRTKLQTLIQKSLHIYIHTHMTLYMCMYSSECRLTWMGVKVTNTLLAGVNPHIVLHTQLVNLLHGH